MGELEELKIFLDSRLRSNTLMERLKAIEDKFLVKKGEAGYPTRDSMAKDTAFLVKNKEKITNTIGPEKYMDVFCRLVKFLEENPEKIEKKPKDESRSSVSIDINNFYSLTGRYDLTYGQYTVTYEPPAATAGSGYYITPPIITYENPDQVAAQPQPQESSMAYTGGTLTIDGLRRALADIGAQQTTWYTPSETVALDSLPEPIIEENNEGEENG